MIFKLSDRMRGINTQSILLGQDTWNFAQCFIQCWWALRKSGSLGVSWKGKGGKNETIYILQHKQMSFSAFFISKPLKSL